MRHLILTLLALLGTVQILGYSCKIDYICYDIDRNNRTATVTYSGYPYNNDYTGHYGGSGLKDKDIVIPSTISYEDIEYTVTAIGDKAFYDCESSILMSSITIPNTVTSIGNQAFYKCTKLTSFEIPNSVTSIGSSAFSGCYSLTSVNIPNSVTSIGDGALDGTAWYNNQPDGLVYAGKVAYKYKGTMPSNTNIVIDEGTVSISPYAFLGCSGLTSITIPNSVTSIGDYAFYGCTSLTSVTVDIATPLAIYSSTFSNRANATLYLPYGSKAAYEAADYWKEFKEIIEMPPSCSTPVLTFQNGKIYCSCETEGVKYVYSVTSASTSSGESSDGVINLGTEFTVSVRATREGYEDSEPATITIDLASVGDMNGDGIISIADVTGLVNVILGK